MNKKNQGFIYKNNTKIGSYKSIMNDPIIKNKIITNVVLNQEYFDFTKSKSTNLFFKKENSNEEITIGSIDAFETSVWADGFNVRIDIAKLNGNL